MLNEIEPPPFNMINDMDPTLNDNTLNFYKIFFFLKKLFDFLKFFLQYFKVVSRFLEYCMGISTNSIYMLKCLIPIIPVLLSNLGPVLGILLENLFLFIKIILCGSFDFIKYLYCKLITCYKNYRMKYNNKIQFSQQNEFTRHSTEEIENNKGV